jgi:hypothetical protein
MSIDSRQHVDVRFFGAHDRAWVPATHCILFSDKDPNKSKCSTPTNNKNASKTQKGIADAMKEKDQYIEKLRELYGFRYASSRQAVNPNDLQGHIEYMLPGLKNPKEVSAMDEGTQKEKLTLKIVKGQSSNNYQVEQTKSAEPRTPQAQKQSEKPKLYKVMSKNDDNADNTDQSGKLQLIIKRKSVVEQECEKVKKVRTSDTSSEASEPSVSSKGTRLYRRKSTKEVVPKHKKTVKKEESETPSEPPPKRTKHSEKQKQMEPPEEDFPESAPKPKAVRRYRLKSVLPEADKPLVVPRVAPVSVPPGTDEIEELRDDSSTSSKSSKPSNRAKNFQRSRSIEKEPEQSSKRINRARSVSISTVPRKAASDVKENVSNHENEKKEPQPSTSAKKPAEESSFDPNLVIKDEPVSDGEEIVQRSALTEKDLQNLNLGRTNEKRVKKTTIVISTVDGEPVNSQMQNPTQQPTPRARKTFPNQPNQLQLEGLITPAGPGRSDWMVCIPQSFSGSNVSSAGPSPPTSNRSTPASEPQLSISQVRPNQVPVSRSSNNVIGNNTSVNVSPVSSNRSQNLNIVPPLTFNLQNETTLHRRDSIQSNQVFVNGQRPQNPNQSNFSHQRPLPELTRIAPRPQGVFSNDGSLFNRDVGPVSRMLTDNAHRISDFFRTVLVDSISAFAPDTPSAENMMLRAEKEKLQRDMQVTKSECQQTMHQLRQEHNEYLETIKKKHGK